MQLDTSMSGEQADASRRQALRVDSLLHRCRNLRILSTLPYTKIEFWNDCVTTHPLQGSRLSYLWRLITQAPKYDLVFLTGGERIDLIYLAFAGLMPWMKTSHVIADAHWQKAHGLLYALQYLLLRMGRRLTAQVQPHSDEEIEIYHRIYGIPIDRLRAVPWGSTLTGYDVSPASREERGDYLLTGGLSFRDYETLFKAISGMEVQLQVGLPSGAQADALMKRWKHTSNIHFYTDWSNAQFIRKMAGCRMFVIPIVAGLTRSTADQTLVNAMHFGKIVIATDSIGPRIYIRHGINGFLVPAESAQAWREAIRDALTMPVEVQRVICERAAYSAQVEFNESLRMIRTL
ncbi:MAG: glycosyltransferase, partial [Burkholderiales bacterium]|nr:glycosyltransferase [Burkholderiales bacterium]